MSDDALLDGLATGDPDATAAFIERFQRRVFGMALRIVNDPRLAEDVAQETFLRAWQRSSAFDPRRGTFSAWLLTIARNLAIDTVRLRRIVIVEPDEILARPDEGSERSPDDLAQRSSETERLCQALGDLRRSSAVPSSSPRSTGVPPGRSRRASRSHWVRRRSGSALRYCGCVPRWSTTRRGPSE